MKSETTQEKKSGAVATDGKSDVGLETIVVEEDFWVPFQQSFGESIHEANVNYREGREKLACGEIKKAISWLKLAKGMTADKESEADLEIAIVDLTDLVLFLEKGELGRAAKMKNTFARAANALAKHHNFKANQAIAKDDMKKAAHHLVAAAFNLRQAALNAKHEYGDAVVAVVKEYGLGYVEESTVIEKNKLKEALNTIAAEISTLEKKVKEASE